ncbi:unnamed protein product [Cuscuta epithymum]|uniref:Hydroxyproline-rich glycoprotein family protein n=1 Tax=Cuscuta epithymum TaxID=186058 RepID=A0AAV0GD72_9ASTE|nr:unnamed protein product [Cuscuta epithymum]
MKGGRYSREGSKAGLVGIEKKIESLRAEDPPLSGAYIRSLVKLQLTSSSSSSGDGFTEVLAATPPPPQRKKQARRRLHTTRPYQERLLNMAEARREIVTALKFHRAAMKQKQQQGEQPAERRPLERSCSFPAAPHPGLPPPFERQQEQMMKFDSRSRVICPPFSSSSSSLSPPSHHHHPMGYYYSVSPPPPPPVQENLTIDIANQQQLPLGLNLNFQDFDNLEATPYYVSPSIADDRSPSSSSLPPSAEDMHHPALDEKEISEIKSIGEKQQIEWNENLNLATSSLWLEFLKTVEIGSPGEGEKEKKKRNGDDDEDYYSYGDNNGCCSYPLFQEAVDFPATAAAWFNDGCLEEPNLNEEINRCHHDDKCFQNPALPCIEDIEENDGEWLAGEE